MSVTAYLIIQISSITGKVIGYDVYSERSPSIINPVIQYVIEEASGRSFEDAKNNLLEKIRMKINKGFECGTIGPYVPINRNRVTPSVNLYTSK